MDKIVIYCGEKFILSEETAKYFKDDVNIIDIQKIPNSDNYQIEMSSGNSVYFGRCKKYNFLEELEKLEKKIHKDNMDKIYKWLHEKDNECDKITFENKAVDLKTYPYDIAQENNVLYDHDNSINIRIDDREYTKEEVLKILKKHKEEEDKKYHKCERCEKKYLENNRFNMVEHNLDKKPDNCSAWGYMTTPYIRGFKVLSTCGDGREIKLCNDCIYDLKKWFLSKGE